MQTGMPPAREPWFIDLTVGTFLNMNITVLNIQITGRHMGFWGSVVITSCKAVCPRLGNRGSLIFQLVPFSLWTDGRPRQNPCLKCGYREREVKH